MLTPTQTLRYNAVYENVLLGGVVLVADGGAWDVCHRDAGLHVLEHLPEIVPEDREVRAALSRTRGRVELQYIE